MVLYYITDIGFYLQLKVIRSLYFNFLYGTKFTFKKVSVRVCTGVYMWQAPESNVPSYFL